MEVDSVHSCIVHQHKNTKIYLVSYSLRASEKARCKPIMLDKML